MALFGPSLFFYFCVNMKNTLLALFLACGLTACLSEEEDFAGYTPSQAFRLVSGDTLKTWAPVSMSSDGMVVPSSQESCALSTRYIFTSVVLEDSLPVYLKVNLDQSCQSDTLVYFWSSISGEEGNVREPAPRLIVGTDSGNVIVRLNELTDSMMEWQFLQEDGEEPTVPELTMEFVYAND